MSVRHPLAALVDGAHRVKYRLHALDGQLFQVADVVLEVLDLDQRLLLFLVFDQLPIQTNRDFLITEVLVILHDQLLV